MRELLGSVQSRGAAPRIVWLGAGAPDGKLPFPLMSKGERFFRCRIENYMLGERDQRHGSRGSDGHRGSMSDITSILHDMTSILH